MRIVPPNPMQNVTTVSGHMTNPFSIWTQLISQTPLIVGTGSPEGAQEAQQGQMYMDDAGTAGAILYVKRDADIGGDKTQGWILV